MHHSDFRILCLLDWIISHYLTFISMLLFLMDVNTPVSWSGCSVVPTPKVANPNKSRVDVPERRVCVLKLASKGQEKWTSLLFTYPKFGKYTTILQVYIYEDDHDKYSIWITWVLSTDSSIQALLKGPDLSTRLVLYLFT